MRILVAAIGRLKKGPESDLVARYCDRVKKTGKSVGISKLDVIEIPESRAAQAQQRKADETGALLARASDTSLIIAFDERGDRISSKKFSSLIGKALDQGQQELILIIGGPDGLSESLRAKANHVISFGGLTIPHQIVRALVLEQIYRATTILTGHPYHRE